MTKSSQPPSRPQRISKRRESRQAYYHDHLARYFTFAGSASASDSSSPSAGQRDPNGPVATLPVQIQHQSLVAGPADPAYLELLGFSSAPSSSSSSHAPGLGQQPQAPKEHYQSPSCLVPYTFPSTLPPGDSTPVVPLAPGSSSGYHFVSQASARDVFPADGDDVDMSDPGSQGGSLDGLQSFNSVAPSIGSQASSGSERFVYPVTGATFSAPAMAAAIGDLSLSHEYYRTRQPLDQSYSPGQTASPQLTSAVAFDNDLMNLNWNNSSNLYGTGYGHWDPTPLTNQQLRSAQPAIGTELSQSPWNVERLREDNGANAGCVAFEPDRGTPYDAFRAGEEYLTSGQPFPVMFGPDPVSPMLDDESDWELVRSYASSMTVHDSPKSEGLSWCQVESSPQNSPSPYQVTGHAHLFSTTAPRAPSPRPPRGRQRALTTQEKQEASDVRKAKACWACHLSKIKCSPCSQDTPCQQCERLTGKRRFCLLRCFNDPLESLQKFVMPEYLTGHFTQARVEATVAENATSWGTYEMHIRMSWGYQRPVEATVVALALPSQSRLAYNDHTDGSFDKKPVFIRKKSPPLGIQLASFVEMKKDYGRMVTDIVMEDLHNYVPVPYCDEESGLPERLLQIICSFYTSGLNENQECTLLREALEIHVISTILERNLNLDNVSKRQVEEHLNEEYADRCAPKCAQQQIKYALFMAQQERVVNVLKDWGAMMWSSNKTVDVEQKWATSFSVLVVLILIVDKMVESAYLLYDGRIRNHGRDASAELQQFEELVRLTQTHVFEQSKEIFHSSFKTRKGGKEACNPIRDGVEAFRGRRVPDNISRLVRHLQRAHSDFGPEIRSQLRFGAGTQGGEYYENAGRLASVFLGDFLDPC